MWYGVWSGGIIRPFFFEGNVTGEAYLSMLGTFLHPQLEDFGLGQLHFQQDGAPAHWALAVRHWLDHHLQDRWIGWDGPIRWPAHLSNITPMAYWLWGHLKSLVYVA